MALTKEQKQKVVNNLKEKIDQQKSMVFVAVEGLKSGQLFDLRKRLRQADCLLTVAKKTLFNIVLKEKKLEIKPKELAGQMALIFGFKDEISAAKIAYQFSLENENLKILGGVYENRLIGVEEVISLAKIPTREELLAKLVGIISSPLSGFVNVLRGNIKGLITVLAKAKT